jgi:hypothetical protein
MDSTIKSIAGVLNDSIAFTFTVLKKEDIGTLQLTVSAPDSINNYFLILKNDKGGILEERMFVDKIIIKQPKIAVGAYTCMLIADENKNKRWDAGNYNKLKQSEKVYYYPNPISVKPNWDIEEEWNLRSANPTPVSKSKDKTPKPKGRGRK